MTLPQRVSLTAGLLSLLTIFSTYLIAASHDSVAWCITFLQGCTSITETGIFFPEAYVLRAGLISSGVFMVIWWYCMRAYLRELRPDRWSWWLKSLFTSSVFASIMMIISITLLGPDMGDPLATKELWIWHTITAVIFFITTTINQVLTSWWLKHSIKAEETELVTLKFKILINILQVLFLIGGAISLVVDFSLTTVNIIEWWLALLVCMYFLTSYWDWKDFRLTRHEHNI